MSKTHLATLDDSHDSGVSTEKGSEGVNTSQESTSSKDYSLRRQQFGKISFKSLTALSAKDSLENLQKIRRQSDGSRRMFFNRGPNSNEKRAKKNKYHRKKFDKPNVSEVMIRKVAYELSGNEKDKIETIASPRKCESPHNLVLSTPASQLEKSKVEKSMKEGTIEPQLDENDNNIDTTIVTATDTKSSTNDETESADSPREILQYFEKLRSGDDHPAPVENKTSQQCAQNLDEAKSVIDYSSGDVQQDYSLDLDLGGSTDESFAGGMACAQLYDSKRRSVQWKREVDVIYYAGDADGGRVVRRENEPLREEAEQQARRNRFIQMALTKNLLSNMSACQLRDPWLAVLPK